VYDYDYLQKMRSQDITLEHQFQFQRCQLFLKILLVSCLLRVDRAPCHRVVRCGLCSGCSSMHVPRRLDGHRAALFPLSASDAGVSNLPSIGMSR